MMGLWARESAQAARSLMHTERVWLRRLTKVSCPQPQLTPSVCISRLTRARHSKRLRNHFRSADNEYTRYSAVSRKQEFSMSSVIQKTEDTKLVSQPIGKAAFKRLNQSWELIQN